ncbi:DUF6233 domain-containing protein [Streptomyces sp. NPDC005531]|uniref:DUF6233 domain-containing protein n=1 Tax=Streptomyces sp. NPDC005531 TaxID=3364722 RepID=UPI003683D76B
MGSNPSEGPVAVSGLHRPAVPGREDVSALGPGDERQRVITREQALAALVDGIRACIHCRPDTELGALG